jgi:hypothetical protein
LLAIDQPTAMTGRSLIDAVTAPAPPEIGAAAQASRHGSGA